MSRPPPMSLAALSASVLAEVEREDRVKEAEVAALRAAAPTHESEIGQLLQKLAEDVRAQPSDLTYDDLQAFVEGRL